MVGTAQKRRRVSESPQARPHKDIRALSDLAAWDCSDGDILAAARDSWWSSVYDHYNTFLERHLTATGEPGQLVFRFECKTHPLTHAPHYRERVSKDGTTSRLLEGVRQCKRKHGGKQAPPVPSPSRRSVPSAPRVPPPQPQPSRAPQISGYSDNNHRTLLAMRACVEHTSPASVVSSVYQVSAQILRPGAFVPSPDVVVADIKQIYSKGALSVAAHFQQLPGTLHLGIDGWNGVTESLSRVGIIIFWYENNKLWRATLDVVNLGELDDDNYLAYRVAECLKTFQIESKIMSVCGNNAPQNDKLIAQLIELGVPLRGATSRVRDFLHTIGLMSKSFMSPFYPAYQLNSEPDDIIDSMLEGFSKLEYDAHIVQATLSDSQTQVAAAGINVPEVVLADTGQLMPLLSRRARHLDETASLPVRQSFRLLAAEEPELSKLVAEGTYDSDPDVALRPLFSQRTVGQWNMDHAFLKVNSILGFLGVSHRLEKYKLTEDQATLSEELSTVLAACIQSQFCTTLVSSFLSVLKVFQEVIGLFSRTSTPFLHEAFPELLTLRARLQDVRDDFFEQGLSAVTRLAAQAAINVFDKFMSTSEDSDIYEIAVVMRPDHKLKWFSDRGYDTARIRGRIVERFSESYTTTTGNANPLQGASISLASYISNSASIWTQRHSASASVGTQLPDTIDHYLQSPTISPEELAKHGGAIAYWTTRLQLQPQVARMALDYLTAPASSVNPEFAFSDHSVNTFELEDQVDAETLRAQLCIPSWYQTPLMPDVQSSFRFIH